MGCSRPDKAIKTGLQYLLGIFLFLSLTGCPPPRMHLWFQESGRELKNLQKQVLHGQFELLIESRPNCTVYCQDYSLYLPVRIKWTKSVSPAIEIRPSSIEVLIEGLPMTMTRGGEPFSISADTLQSRQLFLPISFHREIKADSAIQDANANSRPWAIDIVLHDFLIYESEVVPIDTIRALDWRPCGNELMTPDERRALRESVGKE